MADPVVITLEEARRRLGENVVVALEPGAQWVFDPGTGRSGRLDGRFFDIRSFNRGNYWQLGVCEEPGVTVPEGEPRIVGNLKISRNANGLIKSRMNRALDGSEFREAVISSLSNPELVRYEEAAVLTALILANPQRIDGYIRVFLVDEEFSDTEGVLPSELRTTTDGRTLSALAALGL